MHSLLRLRPRSRVLRGLCAPVLVATTLAAAGCGDDPITNPDQPTPTSVTETFTGKVTVNGAITQPFVVQTAGTVSATITVLDPATYVVGDETRDTTLGLSLGTWNGLVCTVGAPTLANDKAKAGVTLTASATATGNYCVRVYDTGELRQATDFELTVTHF